MKPLYQIKLFLILLFQLVGGSFLFGQGFLINQVRTLETRNALTNKSYSDIEGSPYYTKNFTGSRIYDCNGNFTDLPLRYDIFQDEMEFMKDGKIRWINKNEPLLLFTGKIPSWSFLQTKTAPDRVISFLHAEVNTHCF
jgi:hypothetical protein